MEAHRAPRVLPSNGQPFLKCTSPLDDLVNPLSPQVCLEFNHGLDCGLCGLQHACSLCGQTDHGANSCKPNILRDSSGNVGSYGFDTFDHRIGIKDQYENTQPSIFDKTPWHSAQAAIRLQKFETPRGPFVFDRPELRNEKFKTYREKARKNKQKNKDTGKEEIVWLDEIEEAFQIGWS